MASIRYYTKLYKGEFQVFLSVSYRPGARFRYYTGVKIPTEYWDSGRQTVKASRHFPQHSEISMYLRNLSNEATRIQVRFDNEGQNLTNEKFKQALDAFRGKEKASNQPLDFFQFFEHFIPEREANPEYAKGSITVYCTSSNKFGQLFIG